MPKAKKGKKKAGRKKAARRAPARKARRATRSKPRAAGGASATRIAELEAENRRLREEIAALRGEGQPSEPSDSPPTLEM